MLKDPKTLKDIQSSWETVRLVQAMVRTNLNAGAFGLIPQTDQFRNLAHNLVLFFAFSVLEDALKQCRDEELFVSKGSELRRLMEASKSVVAWADYATIDSGRDKRNAVAHKRQFLPRAECWQYIDAIEKELIAWAILPGPVQKEYTISLTPKS